MLVGTVKNLRESLNKSLKHVALGNRLMERTWGYAPVTVQFLVAYVLLTERWA